MEHGPTWLTHIPGLPSDPETLHVNGAAVVFAGICVFAFFAYRGIKGKIESRVIPSSRFSFVTVTDLLVEGLHNLVVGIAGHHGEHHLSFVGACFFFVWFSNLLGLLPLSASPSSNLNTTYALGVASFLYYNIMGIKAHGLKHYLQHFMMGMNSGLMAVLGVGVMFVEFISHAVRPFSLGLRLAVNLQVDHELATAFSKIAAWLVPVPVLLFGVVVCTIQAFLFAVLSTVYVQMATEHE